MPLDIFFTLNKNTQELALRIPHSNIKIVFPHGDRVVLLLESSKEVKERAIEQRLEDSDRDKNIVVDPLDLAMSVN